MPARHRCLCQSRPVIWLNGLYIQLKRGGLLLRRFFASLQHASFALVSVFLSALKWLVAFPPRAVHWLWTSLFWPSDEAEASVPQPASQQLAPSQTWTEDPSTGPTWWERIKARTAMFWRAICRWTRIGCLHLRRFILRLRMAFQKQTAWTLATVTGSLGIVLMLVMQLIYSFQTLKAKETPVPSPTYHTVAKTRIDPGFPQLRTGEPRESEDLAQIDPFTPAQPDRSAMPQQPPIQSPDTPTQPEPLDSVPSLQPVPTSPDRQPPREREPFIDPLDNLPPFDPNQSAPQPQPRSDAEPGAEPYSPIPTLPAEPKPASPLSTEPPPSGLPQTPSESVPNPRAEPTPFDDPLDNLPRMSNPPNEQPGLPPELVPESRPMPPVAYPVPEEPDPFVDPLDRLPPSQPQNNLPPTDFNPTQPPLQSEEEFVPPTTPMPPSQNPPMDSNPIVDPLENLPRLPADLIPGGAPMPPVANPPQTKTDPFVDPLDNLPPMSNPPEEEPGPPLEFVPEAKPMPPMANPVRTEPSPFVDPLDNLPPTSNPRQEEPGPPLEFVPEAKPMPPMANPVRTEPSPFVDPLDNLPPVSNPPKEQPGPPLEFVPEAKPMPPMASPPQTKSDPFVDPLDNLPPMSNPPKEQPGPPLEFVPEAKPMTPVANPPQTEPYPFVDPLDNLPPMSNPPKEQPGPPLEFVPESKPISPVANPPQTKTDPFVDPLDNLPPMTPLPERSEPVANPLEREPQMPVGDGVSPVELGVGFQRLPADRSERFLLESGSEYRRNTMSREIDFDAWERYLDQKRLGPVSPRPYWERLSLDERRRLEQDLLSPSTQSSYEPLHQNPQGELNVEIAKTLPSRSTAHEPLKYEIVVENRGREMIEHVDVDEAIPPTHLLTDVKPAGHFENNLLRWRLREIRPGEQRRLAVEVIPSKMGTIETTTAVRPSTRVAAVTEVAAAAIRLRRAGYRKMALDQSVLFTNHVENLSLDTQRDISIVEKVPKGYRVNRVEHGGIYNNLNQTITWNLASLPAGETAKLNVYLQAESTGELVSRVKASTRDGEAVPILARVFVDRQRTDRIATPVSQSRDRRMSSARCSVCGCRCCTACCR